VKWTTMCALLATWAAVGCVTLPTGKDQPGRVPTAAIAIQEDPKVNPDQITDANAHEVAAQLSGELDRDAQLPQPGTARPK
jgi:hypothetical protein